MSKRILEEVRKYLCWCIFQVARFSLTQCTIFAKKLMYPIVDLRFGPRTRLRFRSSFRMGHRFRFSSDLLKLYFSSLPKTLCLGSNDPWFDSICKRRGWPTGGRLAHLTLEGERKLSLLWLLAAFLCGIRPTKNGDDDASSLDQSSLRRLIFRNKLFKSAELYTMRNVQKAKEVSSVRNLKKVSIFSQAIKSLRMYKTFLDTLLLAL